MKYILTIFLLSLFAAGAGSQIITIKDEDTGQPIEGVVLISGQPVATTTTNAKGQADVTAFRGAERIELRGLGYLTQTASFAELEAAGFNRSLLPSNINFDEVVVSATRWNQKAKEIPVKIIAISQNDIALENPQTAADMLANSGYVFMQKSQQGGGSPMIRGFATNRLIYTVDGVRMNTAIFRGGNIQNVISLDPFAMEKAEVVFGPGSVIYGSDAIGGVMSFQTLYPELSLDGSPMVTGKAVMRYASANHEKTGHFDVNVGWKKWGILSSFSSNDYGDLRMGNYGPDEYLRPFYVQRQDSTDILIANDDPRVQRPSGYSQVNMMQKLRFKPNEKWDIQYGFHFSETSAYSRYDRHIRYRGNGLPRYGEWSYGPQVWRMNNLNVTHNGNNSVYDQMSLRLARQYFEESRMDRDINQDERHIRREEVIANSFNLDFLKSIGSRQKLFYGIEVVQNDVTSGGVDENIATGESAEGPSRYPEATWASYGVYVSHQWNASDKFTLQSGLRYNQFKLDATFDTRFYPLPFTTAELNNGALTGSLGLVYRPASDWVLSLNGASALRSPNVDDVGKVFDSEPGAVTVPNPDLQAEYAWSGDAGIAKIFGSYLKIDFTGYYTRLNDALVRRDFTLNGQDSIDYDGTLSQVQAIQNAAFATVYGIQAGFEWKLPLGFGISSDINYQKGEEELDDQSTSPSRHAAPWFGISRLTYSGKNLRLQFTAEYSGEVTHENLPEEEKGKPEIYAANADGKPYSPGWYTLNFNALYRVSDHWSVSAGMENLTDQRYRPYSSGIVAPGRNFILSLRANF
ncbi:MAG: TonB-dependent receptor [Saprospiraceae bacterium]|nr:TonB-dependent receptor [Saprospiraceae bacterium]